MTKMTSRSSYGLMHGRHVKGPPKPTPEQNRRAKLKRKVDQRDEMKAKEREQISQAQAAADTKHAQSVRDVTLLRAGQAGLSGTDVQKLVNAIENARRAWVQAGRQGTFDAYAVINAKLGAMGRGAEIGGSSPLDAARPLPPSRGEGRRPPPGSQDPEADVRRQAQDERARRAAEKRQHAQDDYRARLARLGLSDPTNPIPGNGGTFGL